MPSSTSKSKPNPSLPVARDADILLNKINLSLAKSQRLVASWLSSSSSKTSDPTQNPASREQDEDFKDKDDDATFNGSGGKGGGGGGGGEVLFDVQPELYGLGYQPPSSSTTTAPSIPALNLATFALAKRANLKAALSNGTTALNSKYFTLPSLPASAGLGSAAGQTGVPSRNGVSGSIGGRRENVNLRRKVLANNKDNNRNGKRGASAMESQAQVRGINGGHNTLGRQRMENSDEEDEEEESRTSLHLHQHLPARAKKKRRREEQQQDEGGEIDIPPSSSSQILPPMPRPQPSPRPPRSSENGNENGNRNGQLSPPPPSSSKAEPTTTTMMTEEEKKRAKNKRKKERQRLKLKRRKGAD